MSNRLPDLAFAAAAAALGIGIVFVFRSMYLAEDILPFAQEMTLIFLGAVVTIILTAALLNRQTDLELRKEGRVIILPAAMRHLHGLHREGRRDRGNRKARCEADR
ncbi:hypothetical protein [Aureimonas altamirensis]|uniref:hypothetical protein n=1 Tax=Aureimonas altamirensis TaxID=370622 RepID=UPI0025559BA8|nr:hypothetical protein [Aureimonas altamirensis]